MLSFPQEEEPLSDKPFSYFPVFSFSRLPVCAFSRVPMFPFPRCPPMCRFPVISLCCLPVLSPYNFLCCFPVVSRCCLLVLSPLFFPSFLPFPLFPPFPHCSALASEVNSLSLQSGRQAMYSPRIATTFRGMQFERKLNQPLLFLNSI